MRFELIHLINIYYVIQWQNCYNMSLNKWIGYVHIGMVHLFWNGIFKKLTCGSPTQLPVLTKSPIVDFLTVFNSILKSGHFCYCYFEHVGTLCVQSSALAAYWRVLWKQRRLGHLPFSRHWLEKGKVFISNSGGKHSYHFMLL